MYIRKIKIPTFILALLLSVFSIVARDIVPFEVDSKTGLPRVEVFVNNDPTPFNFIFDTGCSVVMANANNTHLMDLLNLCDSDTVEYSHSTEIIRKTAFDNSLMLGLVNQLKHIYTLTTSTINLFSFQV